VAYPVCVSAPSGLVSWWPGDGNANDFVGGNEGILQGGMGFLPGKVADAFSLDGVDDGVALGNDNSLRITASISLVAWVWFNDQIKGAVVTKHASPPYRAYALATVPSADYFRFIISGDGTARAIRDSQTPLEPNTWYLVAGVYDAAAHTMAVYVNGTLDNGALQGLVPAAIYDTSTDAAIGRNGNPADYFDGLIDEVVIFDRALSAAEIRAIYDAGSAGMCKPPVSVEHASWGRVKATYR